MACTFNILDQLLPGAANGGTWNYIGWNANDRNGAWTTPPSGNPSIIGSNPQIDTDTWDVGYHYLSYDDGCNDLQFVKYWKKDFSEAGTGTDASVCRETSPVVDLNGQLTGNDLGNWSVSGAGLQPPSGSFDSVAGTFTLSPTTPPGDYIFIFTAEFDESDPDFTFLNCKVCTDTEQITITVTDACDAGVGGNFGISAAEGSFNLYDLLSGTPEQGITWTQIAGTIATITGGYLGTVDLDALSGCYWEFRADCGSGDCADSSTIIITRQPTHNPTISETNGGVDLTVTHGACPNASYEWFYNDGSGDISIGTTQTITKQGIGDYTVVVECDNQCVQSGVWTELPQSCDNSSSFVINFDESTECIDVTVDDSGINSPIATDTWEYRVDNGAWQAAVFPICGCDIREFFDVNAYCQTSGGNITLGYNTPNHCFDPNTEVDRLWIEWGDGTQSNYTGFLDAFQISVSPSDFLNVYNNSIKFIIRLDTPLGDLFLEIQFSYTGNGSTADCADVTVTKLNAPVIYKDIEIRRIVTFSDGCPAIELVNDWQTPPNCLPYVRLNLTSGSGGTNLITATPYNMGGCSWNPTYEWYLDGVLLAGETSQDVNRNTYGYGVYTVIITCDGCTATDTLVWQLSCDAAVYIEETVGGDLTAVVSGCGANPVTYEWEFWDGSQWVAAGSTQTITPTNNGLYKVEIECNGCNAVNTYFFDGTCTVGVTIANNTGTLLETTVTGCSGTVTYEWFEWDGTSFVSLGITTADYDPGQNGTYGVNVTCGNCTDFASITLACNVTASITDNGNGSYTGNLSGCGGAAITWLWEYSTNGGTTWSTYSSSQTISGLAAGLYRLTGTCGNCSDEALLTISGCSLTSVTITQNGSTLEGNQSGCTSAVTWLWEFWNGSSWTFYGNTQNVTANQNGDYRLTGTCGNDPNCQLQDTVTYSGSCTNSVSLSYDSGTNTITASTSGCSGVETISWAYSPNGSAPNNCPGGGWINITSGVYSIVANNGSGCYRAIIFCDGVCPKAATIYVDAPNDCAGLSLTFNSPSANELSFGELEDGGVVVTNYLIKWVDSNDVEVFRSAAGSFYDSNLHYPHPSTGILIPGGEIRPIIIDSDVGTDLDCFNAIVVDSYGCQNTLSGISYYGLGGADATTEITFEVDGSTDSVLIGFRGYNVADKVEVIYDGVTILDTGNQSNRFWKYWRVSYTYVPGQNEMTIRVTNSDPTEITRYDLYAKCCDGGTCPPSIPNPTINFFDFECSCVVSAVSFGQSFLRNLCLGVTSYSGSGSNNWQKQAPITQSIIETLSLTCNDGTASISTNTSTGTVVLPSGTYAEVKTALQTYATTDRFILVILTDGTGCSSDANTFSLALPTKNVTYSFDDPTNTITLTIGTNPYSDADPCNLAGKQHGRWNRILNQSFTGGSAKAANVYELTTGVLNNQEDTFTITLVSECGTEERDFKITWADVNCPCQSWQIREDTNGDGTYDTLIEENPNWGGVCT